APWYPSAYAKSVGVARDSLHPHLDELRMAGLIRLTEWVPEHGQGYVLTPAGEDVVRSPRKLARLRKGKVPTAAEPIDAAVEAPSPWDRGDAVRNALLYPVRPRVTRALLSLNFAVFAVGFVLAIRQGEAAEFLASGAPDVLRQTGALMPVDLQQGEWWRL